MDMFQEKDNSEAAPGFIGNSAALDTSNYFYRIQYFQLGNTDNDDSQAALESLLTRGLDGSGDIIIVERKESISATTGIYTCVVNYMERRPANAEDSE